VWRQQGVQGTGHAVKPTSEGLEVLIPAVSTGFVAPHDKNTAAVQPLALLKCSDFNKLLVEPSLLFERVRIASWDAPGSIVSNSDGSTTAGRQCYSTFGLPQAEGVALFANYTYFDILASPFAPLFTPPMSLAEVSAASKALKILANAGISYSMSVSNASTQMLDSEEENGLFGIKGGNLTGRLHAFQFSLCCYRVSQDSLVEMAMWS
jgi:hypothetical protein